MASKRPYGDRRTEPEVLVADTLEEVLAKDFGAVPQVSHILAEDAPESLLVWIVLEGNPGPDVRRRIYEKELALISEFPAVEFDFNPIPAMGRPLNEIITDATVIYSRQE